MAKFRAKARAVELLGKGQIADLPTAITELWKNGYDAYGDSLEAHLFFPGYKDTLKPFFVLSDDGVGMSENDILEKWVVLGTDSKSRRIISDKPSAETLWKEPRMPTGEKGIGRLSVSYLGSQMLMLSKKIGEPLQVLFFDWRILVNYNLFIDDIIIPTYSVTDNENLDTVFTILSETFLKNFPTEPNDIRIEKWTEQKSLMDAIINDLHALKLPMVCQNEIFGPLISQEAHGTKFIVFDPIDQLIFLKDHAKPEEENEDTIEYIRSGLTGLSNVFKKEKPIFNTSFLIYESAAPTDFINQREFFDHTDFQIADHLIQGSFDKYGVFIGDLKIYKEIISGHTFKPNTERKETSFGPFDIKLGVIPGGQQESLLSTEQFTKLNDKLKRSGGLYLYRDGFRILPYGRRDWDFLEFEERRTRGAGYYFFSYRRMFGYISLSREVNEGLIDKAGREGLINNKAYREFKNTLIAFFFDLARKYYGKGANSEVKNEQQEAIGAQKIEEEREKEERKEFIQNLKIYPKELEELNRELSRLTIALEEQTKGLFSGYDEIESLLRQIDDIKIRIERLSLQPPKKFVPNDAQRKNFLKFQNDLHEVKRNSFSNANDVVRKAQDKLKEKELLEEFDHKLKKYEDSLVQTINSFETDFNQSFKRLQEDFEIEKNDELDSFRKEYSNIRPQKPVRDEIYNSLNAIEEIYNQRIKSLQERINPFIQHLSKIKIGQDEDALVGYYKLEFQNFKEKWAETQELAQLGIAVEIIDHQFNALYSKLAKIIKSLEQSIKEDSESSERYHLLGTNFEHLEHNYKLLTPLYRTTNRVRKDISGKEMVNYIKDFYQKEFEEKNITIEQTDSFLKASFFTYESILKPVFINVINNAIYWLNSTSDRKILFDFIDNKIIIANSGQAIDEVYVKDGDLFKLFFSRRPSGRGIGLYLARTTLNSVGFEITTSLDPKYNLLKGACFLIFEENHGK